MQFFRVCRMSKPCLIPPKGVKRKNSMEGFELFDADEDVCKPGESESESEEDPSIEV